MSKINDGGPAFPISPEVGRAHFDDPFAYPGMTLRDYFAAAALPTLVKNLYAHDAAQQAYEYADAMLAERAKNGGAK